MKIEEFKRIAEEIIQKDLKRIGIPYKTKPKECHIVETGYLYICELTSNKDIKYVLHYNTGDEGIHMNRITSKFIKVEKKNGI